jgi:rod shape-determining protein MreD
MSSSVYVAVPLMAGLALLQSALFSRLPLGGIQLVLLLIIAYTLIAGVQEGLLWAFIGGLFLDLFSLSPVGATSLAYMGTVLAIAMVRRSLPPGPVLLPLLMTAMGTAVYFFIYLALLSLSGQPVNWQATGVTPVVLWHTLLILPLYWSLSGLRRLFKPRQIEM